MESTSVLLTHSFDSSNTNEWIDLGVGIRWDSELHWETMNPVNPMTVYDSTKGPALLGQIFLGMLSWGGGGHNNNSIIF